MVSSVNILIQHRSQVGVSVFARLSANTCIRGSDCLRYFASACGAEYPDRLRSTKLRKQIATLCQMMNLQDHEMDQVAKFMGHDIRVHREYYRLSENTMQLAKISKLLIAIEKGPHAYKGKSLDQIDLATDTNVTDGASELPQSEKNVEGQKKRKDKISRDQKEPRQHSDGSLEDSMDSSEPTQSGKQEVKKHARKSRPTHQKDLDSGPEASEGASQVTQSSSKIMTSQQKKPWSSCEKEAVWKHLGKFKALKKVPGKQDILLCKGSEPALENRT
ncbi:uncharacterized protein LOC109615233 isoform X1 [Esox lucius]|uniref:uncharacterized protein LOC109615233 isoform X1 n=1 Tax=Esox lucius TaxID=8010 RepID=UPI0014774D7A|nr:uncharacterized protein LOC109615233 isoform X1 [Esox lucius]